MVWKSSKTFSWNNVNWRQKKQKWEYEWAWVPHGEVWGVRCSLGSAHWRRDTKHIQGICWCFLNRGPSWWFSTVSPGLTMEHGMQLGCISICGISEWTKESWLLGESLCLHIHACLHSPKKGRGWGDRTRQGRVERPRCLVFHQSLGIWLSLGLRTFPQSCFSTPRILESACQGLSLYLKVK